jgi:hypothetical protein
VTGLASQIDAAQALVRQSRERLTVASVAAEAAAQSRVELPDKGGPARRDHRPAPAPGHAAAGDLHDSPPG